MTRVGAVVLAAGASTRMDGHPKALLTRDGRTAVAHVAESAARAGCDPVIVVVGEHGPRIRAASGVLPDGARVVTNRRAAAGRTGSLQRGLAAVGEDADAVLVWPVDHPCVNGVTARLLVDAWRRHAPRVAVPVHRGRRGHPILLARDALDAVRALGPDAPLRSVVHASGDRLRLVPVPDSGILVNVDTPEQAARAGWSVPRLSA